MLSKKQSIAKNSKLEVLFKKRKKWQMVFLGGLNNEKGGDVVVALVVVVCKDRARV